MICLGSEQLDTCPTTVRVDRRVVHVLCQSEISNFCYELTVEEDIARGKVAMYQLPLLQVGHARTHVDSEAEVEKLRKEANIAMHRNIRCLVRACRPRERR